MSRLSLSQAFAQSFRATLRILAFRAGPQDFPFDARLQTPLIALAMLANALIFSQVLPLATSLAMALAMVGATALVTRSILRTRKAPERFQQTFHALLATGATLTLLLYPLFVQVAPVLRELAAHPEQLETGTPIALPAPLVWASNLLNFWNFAVTAHIFRHAANVKLWLSFAIALLLAFVVLFLVAFAGTFAGALFGAP
jgi:FtsH-binding integral membrane protein